MTTTIGVVSFLALCIGVAQIVLGIQHRRTKRKYHNLWKAERTKAYFAEARNKMLQFAIDGKIDSNTDFFKQMYKLNTTVMRNPNSYKAISDALITHSMNKQKSNSASAPIIYTDEEKIVSKLTADALGHIMIEYSAIVRFFFGVMKLLHKKITKSDFFFFWIKINPEDKKSAELSKNLNKVKYDLLKESGYSEEPHLHHELVY